MGHDPIYAVDSFDSFDIKEEEVNFEKFARENGLEDTHEQAYKLGKENTELKNKILKESGYLALLKLLNSEEKIYGMEET